MNKIILFVAFFGSAVLSEDVRKPKLFFVSTSATTSTLQTASICYVSLAANPPACTGRKRRAISLDGMQPKGAVEGESVQEVESSSYLNEKREGRFLLYWITTTSFTTTYTVSSVGCTAPGTNLCP